MGLTSESAVWDTQPETPWYPLYIWPGQPARAHCCCQGSAKCAACSLNYVWALASGTHPLWSLFLRCSGNPHITVSLPTQHPPSLCIHLRVRSFTPLHSGPRPGDTICAHFLAPWQLFTTQLMAWDNDSDLSLYSQGWSFAVYLYVSVIFFFHWYLVLFCWGRVSFFGLHWL